MSNADNRLLNVSAAWTEQAPTESDYTLLLDGGYLSAHSTDFRHRTELGFIGALNCPIAVDDSAKIAYRATSIGAGNGKDGKIVAFDLNTGEERIVITLPPDMTCSWLLALDPERNRLIALLLSNSDAESQQLATIDIDSGKLATLELDARVFFYPDAIDVEREQIIFSGGNLGAVLINFHGEVIGEIGDGRFSRLEEATFLPDFDEVVFAENGIHIWNHKSNEVQTIVKEGKHPVAGPAGNIWFNSSDGSLALYQRETEEVNEIVGLSGFDLHDTGYAQPIVFSADKRFGIARLTGKTALAPEALLEQESDRAHVS